MAASLEELVNSLYSMVQDAWAIPLGGEKCVVERDRMLDLLDELRVSLPSEVKMAKDIVDKRNELIAAGKREAESIRKQAEEVARVQVSETEIVKQSRRKAKEIMGNAEIQSRELKKASNEYCEDTLKRAEEAVANSLDEVRKARARFKSASSNQN